MGTASRGPVRTCLGCRTTRPKGELLRVARTPTGVRFDPSARLQGRGAYFCPDPACIESVRGNRSNRLRRALRGTGSDEVAAALDALTASVVQHRVPEAP